MKQIKRERANCASQTYVSLIKLHMVWTSSKLVGFVATKIFINKKLDEEKKLKTTTLDIDLIDQSFYLYKVWLTKMIFQSQLTDNKWKHNIWNMNIKSL